jgi:hypothetical protein
MIDVFLTMLALNVLWPTWASAVKKEEQEPASGAGGDPSVHLGFEQGILNVLARMSDEAECDRRRGTIVEFDDGDLPDSSPQRARRVARRQALAREEVAVQ